MVNNFKNKLGNIMEIKEITKTDKVLSDITLDNLNHLQKYDDIDIINFAKEFVNKYKLNNKELSYELLRRNISLKSLGFSNYRMENNDDIENRLYQNKIETDTENYVSYYNKKPIQFVEEKKSNPLALMLVANYFLSKTYIIPDNIKEELIKNQNFSLSDIVNLDDKKSEIKKEENDKSSLVDKLMDILRKVMPKKRV